MSSSGENLLFISGAKDATPLGLPQLYEAQQHLPNNGFSSFQVTCAAASSFE